MSTGGNTSELVSFSSCLVAAAVPIRHMAGRPRIPEMRLSPAARRPALPYVRESAACAGMLLCGNVVYAFKEKWLGMALVRRLCLAIWVRPRYKQRQA